MSPLEHLIKQLSKLPGLGNRSAQRAVLHMLKKKDSFMLPLIEALSVVSESTKICGICGNLTESHICGICSDERRDKSTICVVEDIADLWAMERSGVYKGLYHVLGGTLSALDGVSPEDLKIEELVLRAQNQEVKEVILALNATVEGAATIHYLSERLEGISIIISKLAHGLPIGGELDYMDDGTLIAAVRARRAG